MNLHERLTKLFSRNEGLLPMREELSDSRDQVNDKAENYKLHRAGSLIGDPKAIFTRTLYTDRNDEIPLVPPMPSNADGGRCKREGYEMGEYSRDEFGEEMYCLFQQSASLQVHNPFFFLTCELGH